MITRMEAIAAQTSHASRRPQLRIGAPLRGIAAYLLAIAALFAGIGVLFLIRRAGFLAIGPRVHDALPLQQLAGTDAQPLMHMVIAWVPAGFAAGVALMALTRLGAAARVISLTVLAAAVLLFAGGLSDSISVNDPLSPTWRRSSTATERGSRRRCSGSGPWAPVSRLRHQIAATSGLVAPIRR